MPPRRKAAAAVTAEVGAERTTRNRSLHEFAQTGKATAPVGKEGIVKGTKTKVKAKEMAESVVEEKSEDGVVEKSVVEKQMVEKQMVEKQAVENKKDPKKTEKKEDTKEKLQRPILRAKSTRKPASKKMIKEPPPSEPSASTPAEQIKTPPQTPRKSAPKVQIISEGDEDVVFTGGLKRKLPDSTPITAPPTPSPSQEAENPQKRARFGEKEESPTPTQASAPPPKTPSRRNAKAVATPKSRKTKLAASAKKDGFRQMTLLEAAAASPAVKKKAEEEKEKDPNELPEQLTLLIALHSSLLTSLLLYRAQHGNTHLPAPFGIIRPQIERLSKRKMSLDDLRGIVWLIEYDPEKKEGEERDEKPCIKLLDYGFGKISVEFDEAGSGKKLVNATELKKDFQERIRKFWEERREEVPASSSSPESEETPTTESKSDEPEESSKEAETSEKAEEEEPSPKPAAKMIIPQAPIHAHAHKSSIAILHAKSQRLIKDLKPTPVSKPLFTASKPSTGNPTNRKISLVDRIRAKEAALAATTAPTKEELEFAAAKQRLQEIVPVLKNMAAKSGRGGNMTMKMVVEGVRDSFRNPIATSEVEKAVRILAEEGWEEGGVKVGWVKVQHVGKVVGVVFEKEVRMLKLEGGKFV
ncbi:hypothetical protein RUND412_003851 [Rhizina undulata]